MDSPTQLYPVTLEGEHVRLEPLTLAHAPALAAAASESRDTYGWTIVPDGVEGAEEYIRFALAQQEAGTQVPFATIDRTAGRVVGSTRFLEMEYWPWPAGNPNQRGAHLPDVVEIGYTFLAASAQRTAINTEAKLLMLRHAFETWCVHRVQLMTDERNERSRRAIERLGAKPDGVIRASRRGYDGAIRSDAVYSILEAEWPAVRQSLEARLAARPADTTQRGSVVQLSLSKGGVPKLPVQRIDVRVGGIAGDGHDSPPHIHGGPERAVCLYSLEVIEALAAEGHPIFPGAAGENVTVRGLDWGAVVPGTRLRIGADVLLEITRYTTPCKTNQRWFAGGDFSRMHHNLHPGWSRVYARVVREGEVRPGDPVELLSE